MSAYPIDVLASGAVVLGPEVVCDGFLRARKVRVQSHVHDDHMADFERSKGFQDLLMSVETHRLLLAEFNADLEIRDNLYPLAHKERRQLNGCSVTLIPSGHMLGAVQTQVELPDGTRLGYSGDFSWPLDSDSIMSCDALVVDSTYGSPQSVRDYSQEEAETRLLELIHAKIRRGAVHVHAHRGTIQRALQLLSPNLAVPILCSERLCGEITVYRRFGTCVGEVVSMAAPDSRDIMASGRYVRLYSKGDRFPQPPDGVAITLSAFMARRDDPLLEYSDRAYRVALSNHADFLGTLEYVRATGARYVVTDNTRTHGVELARALRDRLGVMAVPSTNFHSHEWGE